MKGLRSIEGTGMCILSEEKSNMAASGCGEASMSAS